ncbi:MAG: cytochrome P450, partial [Ilumatobacteraceae bacterium]|nr:cytochrome P450 [Ilumatobacteraceae bacterium]
LRDKRWHSATGMIAQLQGITDEAFLGRRQVSILNAEGDVHVRLRRLVAPAFSPRSADRLRPFMRETVNSLLDPFAASGKAEVVSDICEPYPIPIICELLGAPKEDWKLFSRLATEILLIFSENLAENMSVFIAAQQELEKYTEGLIEKRRSVPADDLITDLIAAEEAGDKLNTEELTMMVDAVIVGGTDTTRNQLGLALALFAEYPEQWALLGKDPSLAQRAVEEVLRFSGAVGGTIRFASEDIEYNGVLFPKGTFMSTSMSTGNYDASVFPTPEKFDITREPVGQPHLSLGAGIHYCLGASLARAELQEAFTVLSQRMLNLELDGPVVYKPSGVGIFGPASLPVKFTASN